jgi:putative multiple sugar transport system permease protein
VLGSIVGGLVMAVLNNGLQLMGVGSDRVQIIKGLVLLAAVALDVYNKNQGRPSILGYLMRRRPAAGDRPSTPTGPGNPGTPVTAGTTT